jgi:ubiquinone/menaquinone biosynthesis C-methylase UbiE
LGLDNIEASIRSVEKLALEPHSLDAAYGRWILSWVADVPAVFEQVTCALRPGGAYIMQEYLDWQAMKLLPRSQVFETAIQACMQSWTRGVGKINIAEEVPALACAVGLKVESFAVNARSGQPGTPVWNWLGEFLQSYLARLVRQGAFGQADYEAFCSEWSERTQDSNSVIIAPVVADVVLRRPG